MNRSQTRFLFPRPRPAADRRVVVTGGGIITALGENWAANERGFREGLKGVRPVSLFDVSKQRARVAAEAVPPGTISGTRLPAKRLARIDRATRLLLTATHEAWAQSGWIPSEDLPVILGTTSGGMPLGEAYYRGTIADPPARRGQPTRVLNYQAHRQVIDLLDSLGCTGSITIIANACASGSNAIGHAWEAVRSGQADRVLTGGYDGLCHLVFAGFDSLQALSTTTCRPFDTARDGLVLGEAAAVFALETPESAQRRGAGILGEIIGYGASTDIHHLTQPQPEGRAALASMRAATDVAGLHAADVHYINAHGTGTVLNDAAEAAAINAWAGNAAPHLRVSSTKGAVGHTLGAAGAVEAAVCLMALQGQWLPPSVTTLSVDPACAFDYIRRPAQAALEVVLSNSFGFGGANATLIFRRWR